MFRFKIISLCVVSFLTNSVLNAQQLMNVWLRGTLQLPVSENIKTEAEYQYRQNINLDNDNVADKKQFQSVRLWAHYKHNDDVIFSVSPIAYFSKCKTINNINDKTRNYTSELRSSVALTLQHKLLKHLYIFDRTAAEYRVFSNYEKDIVRLRNRIGLRYNFSKNLNLSLFDEHLFNVIGTEHHHFFDQNRIALNIDYNLSSKIKLDVGCMTMEQLPLTGYTLENEQVIYLNFTYKFL